MLAAAILGLSLSLQATQQLPVSAAVRDPVSPSLSVPVPTDTSATAVRAAKAPVIDGKGDDEVWQTTPVISTFKQWRPNEDKAPRYKTEAKIAYDAANLYVLVRAFDPHPDSIIRLLERRDSWTASEMIWVFVDSYHDTFLVKVSYWLNR